MTNLFELENNRLIKNLLQLLEISEDVLAKELGVTKEVISNWKKGIEIPTNYKRKIQRLTFMAEHGKSFMKLIEKLNSDIENGSLLDDVEPDIYTEDEALLAQAINKLLSPEESDEFIIWNSHNHYTISSIKRCFDHHIFSAYVGQLQNTEYQLYPNFIFEFLDCTNIYSSWIFKQKAIHSFDEVECEIAHVIIDAIINLACKELVENGFDSDYEDAHEISRSFQLEAENCIEQLIEIEKIFYGEVDINYYELLNTFEKIIDVVSDAELEDEDPDFFDFINDSDYDHSAKIDKHLPLGSREILKNSREILESTQILRMKFVELAESNALLIPLLNATQELNRLKLELKNHELSKHIKVNEKVLKSCLATLRERDIEV